MTTPAPDEQAVSRPRRISIFTLIALSASFVFLSGYVLGYYLTVARLSEFDGAGGWKVSVVYPRLSGETGSARTVWSFFFAPMHGVDRLIRSDYWAE